MFKIDFGTRFLELFLVSRSSIFPFQVGFLGPSNTLLETLQSVEMVEDLENRSLGRCSEDCAGSLQPPAPVVAHHLPASVLTGVLTHPLGSEVTA